MSQYARIPLLKNEGVVLKPGRSAGRATLSVAQVLLRISIVFAIMLVYVWLKVETNLTLSQIGVLETRLNEIRHEREKLEAEVVRLSSFGRIRKIAQEHLGLTFIPSEQIVEVSRVEKSPAP